MKKLTSREDVRGLNKELRLTVKWLRDEAGVISDERAEEWLESVRGFSNEQLIKVDPREENLRLRFDISRDNGDTR